MTGAPTGDGALPPAPWRVRLAREVLVRDGGRLLAGGAPFRVLRLSPGGAAVVAAWRSGGPVGPGAARALARRLLDAGVLVGDPEPAGAIVDAEVVVVVPVRDRPQELDRCLAAVARDRPRAPRVVVDDGSADPAAIAAVAAAHGATVVRHAVSRGPAAARNAGLAATDRPLVAFVDSDVVVAPGWLSRLAGQLADPVAGAAAPRVLGLRDAGPGLAGYEARRSSLDMGPAPAGAVGPGRPLSFVPATALLVRRAAMPAGGFDERLQVGEDVDLAWRLAAGGWRLAYDPAATVRHEHRLAPGAFVVRRFAYARSIGALSVRHPEALAAVYAEPVTAAALGLLLARRPVPAAAVLAYGTLRLRRRLAGRGDRPALLAAELMGRGLLASARGGGHAVRRAWSPALLAATVATGRRGPAALVLGAQAARLLEPRGPTVRDAPIAVLDDLIAALGTWTGCLEHRAARPLLPVWRRG